MSSQEIEKLKQENEFLKQELNRIRHAHNELKRTREKKKVRELISRYLKNRFREILGFIQGIH